jgi:hypothetical protein
MVGYTANPGSLCGHMLEKCLWSKGNHIAFSNRCATKTDVAKAAHYSWGLRLAGWESANTAGDLASVTNRVVLGQRAKGSSKDAGGSEAELVDAEKEEAITELEDITMMEIVTTATSETGTDT